MSAPAVRKMTFSLVLRKTLLSGWNMALAAALAALVLLFWAQDSFQSAFSAYLLFFPHLFLLFSRDLFRGEMESGALENVLFLKGGFKDYLLFKSLFTGLSALLISAAGFVSLGAWALLSGQFSARLLWRFLAGVMIGLYYSAAAGILSFYLRAGSNVMAVVLGQALLFLGLLLSATQKTGFITFLEVGRFPGFVSKIEFLALVAVFPNILVLEKFFAFLPAVGLLSALGWTFQVNRLRGMEITRE